jgi:ABC-type uncharacterized transport system substrate-binding protein
MDRRRFLLTSLAGELAAPLVAEAQPAQGVRRIGLLGSYPAAHLIEALRQGLRNAGWVEGQNIVIESRWARGNPERLRDLAAELVQQKVEVIVLSSSLHVEAARRVTSTIPIVFGTHADPIETGHVKSLARPGGNITGVAILQTELTAKGVELLKEVVSKASRMAELWDPATPSHKPGLKAVAVAAERIALQFREAPVRTVRRVRRRILRRSS